MQDISTLPAEGQSKFVVAKLKELHPQFVGALTNDDRAGRRTIANGLVIEFGVNSPHAPKIVDFFSVSGTEVTSLEMSFREQFPNIKKPLGLFY